MSTEDQSALRDRRLQLAVASAFFSKGGGLALQVLALPLILRSLGKDGFAIYSLAGSILAFQAFAQLGIGPYLTQRVATLRALGLTGEIGRLVWTSVAVVAVTGMLLALALGIIERALGLEWLWGEVYLTNRQILTWGYYFTALIGVATVVFNIFSATQAGYQELHFSNLYGGLANLAAAAAIGTVALLCLGVKSFWAAIYLVPLLVLFFNISHLLRRHAELRCGWRSPAVEIVPELLRAGGFLMVVQAMLPLVQREGIKLSLAHAGDIQGVAHVAIFMQIATIVGGVVGMVTQPLYGGLADAFARGDLHWWKRKLWMLRIYTVSVGLAISAGGFVWGQTIIKLWMGNTVVIGSAAFLAFGAYLTVALCVHVHHIFLMAQGRIRALVGVSALEMIGLSVLFTTTRGVSLELLLVGMAAIQAATSLLGSFYLISKGGRIDA